MRRLAATGLAALLAATPAACSTSRWEQSPGSAVIVHEPSRFEDAERAARVLRSRGWTVGRANAGLAQRSRTSIAVYSQRTRPGRGRELPDLLRPAIGDADLLPFLTDGPGGHDAIVWLAAPR